MRLFNVFREASSRPRRAGRESEAGFALIVVLGILLLVTGLALVAFNTSDTDRQIASNNLGGARAYYAAEAGIIRSNAMLADSLWRDGFSNVSIGNATYSVQVVDSNTPNYHALKDSLLLRSTGSAPGSQSRIDVLLAKYHAGRMFKWAAFGDTSVHIAGNAEIDAFNSDSGAYVPGGMGGNVGSNGYIYINGSNAIIDGNVGTPDTVIKNAGAIVNGTIDNNAAQTTLDPISQDELNYAWSHNSAPAGLTLTGGATYDSVSKALSASGGATAVTINVSGIYCFSSITFTSSSQLILAPGVKAVIYMSGNLNAAGGTIVNTTAKAENLQIYSTGSLISVTGNASLYAAVYAPNASIIINGNGGATGSFVGKSVLNAGNGAVHYDRALRKIKRPYNPSYVQVAWHVL